jgi:hypothetical protein
MGGLFAGLLVPRIREQAVENLVIPSAVAQVVENTVEVIVKETVEIPIEKAVMISLTPEPEQPTSTPIIKVTVITAPSEPLPKFSPTPTEPPITSPDSILEVCEWWKQEGVWLRISKVRFTQFGDVFVYLEIWNRTGSDLFFEWIPMANFSMTDNTGHIYPYDSFWGQDVDNSEFIEIDSMTSLSHWSHVEAANYRDEYLYKGSVTELVFTVTDLSRITMAIWRIPVPK